MYSEPKKKFATLYGRKYTFKEWLSLKKEDRENWLGSIWLNKRYQIPWHCKWDIQRNGGFDYGDEWVPNGSWTARKIIRPSYSQSTAVRLIVEIYGNMLNRKSKPKTWYAKLEVGNKSHSIDMSKPRGCRSLTDACRKAEALPDLENHINDFLKELYSPIYAKAIFKKNDKNEFEPFMTDLGFSYDIMEWEPGEYIETHWYTGWHGEDKGIMKLRANQVERNYSGYLGIYGGNETELIEKVGCWIPMWDNQER